MIDSNLILVTLVVFLAVFTQSLSGFGVALISMALLPNLVGIGIATPLVALVSISIEVILVIHYRQALNFRAVWPIAFASILGIPIGIWALRGVQETTLLFVLGIIIVIYAIYALFQFKLPKLHNHIWPWGVGFLAGILGGAYNTSGPPVIIYGDCRRWPPAEFKSNLQGFFVVSSTFILIGHAVSGNLAQIVWQYYLWSIPAIALGILAGTSLDRFMKPKRFRTIVLVLLIILGSRLMITPLL
jgi:uncharacterized membrane protein YfcA